MNTVSEAAGDKKRKTLKEVELEGYKSQQGGKGRNHLVSQRTKRESKQGVEGQREPERLAVQ